MSRWNDRIIDAMPTPAEIRDAERAAACARIRHRLEDIRDAYAELADLSRAAVTGSAGIRVATSKAAPVPINVDLVDLTGHANAGSIAVLVSTEWLDDQIGHIAVASELDFWVRDWSAERGERLPMPTVPALSLWLADRLEWAWESHGAWDEMATTVERVARALYGTLSPREGRSVPVSAPCPREGCAGVLGRRTDGWVECGAEECGRILSASEYVGWAADVIHREANGGWGITAKEIQLVTTWPAGTIRRLLVEYAITKTGPNERPTLYSRVEWEAAYLKIEAKRQARAEREAARAA